MRRTLLSLPDAFIWQLDPDYRTEVADALWQAFACLSGPRPTQADYLRACMLVGPFLQGKMAVQQRVRVFHLFARANEADRYYERAMRWTNEAMEAAAMGRAYGEQAELFAARGRLWRATGKFQSAADDVQEALKLHYRQAPTEDAIPPVLRLELFALLAGYKFFLAHYGLAQDLVTEARRLTSLAPDKTLLAASALWVEAHLLRTRGLLEEALPAALDAAEVHAREDSLTNQDRMQVFVAELYLDLAERALARPGSQDWRAYLREARDHLSQAKRLARTAKDTHGAALIKVVQTRESRLRGRNENRVEIIERCLRTGERLHDKALQAQGYTALGHEFASQGKEEQAKNCWRDALDALDGSEMPALRLPARRALLLASEFAVV